MSPSAIRRLASHARFRMRLQRFGEALCTALLPALAVTACAVLLAKVNWLTPGELSWIGAISGGTAGLIALVAALWPIPLLGILVRIDQANRFSDRLSSAHAFSALPEDQQTPEMKLHIRRTLALLDQVRVASAQPFRVPRDLLRCLGMALVLGLVGMAAPPVPHPLPPLPTFTQTPEPVVDLGLLMENERQLQELEQLAERSRDETLQAIAGELGEMMDRLRLGTIGEQELLDRLDSIDTRLADYQPPEPIGLDSAWQEVQERIEQAVEEPEALPEQAQALLERIEAGDEGALAQALEQLGQIIETQQLEPELQEELAELLEELADSIDPTDPDLRRQIEEHQEEIRRLQERLAERERSRDRRRFDQALERLARARDQMTGQISDLGREGSARHEITDALREAASALREPPPSGQAGAEEQALQEQTGETPAGEEEQPPEPAAGQTAPEGDQEGPPGEQRQTARSGQQRAASSLEQASTRLRQMDQEQAASEARDQANETAQALRENLQRSSQQPSSDQSAEQAEANWESFMDRADGRTTDQRATSGGEQDAEPPQQVAQSVAQTTEQPGQGPQEGRQEEGEEGRQEEGDHGFEQGGDATQGQATELDSTRIQAQQEASSSGQQEPTTGEVFETAARDGFASRAYRDVYVEYARAAEAALEAEEIPLGFKGFVRRYFQLVEPR